MTIRLSQRSKPYLETARTLLRAAQSMTDRAIASQIKTLADDYERRRASLAGGCSEGAGSSGCRR